MDWINAIIAGVFGAGIWWFGFFCGYVKDKKEVQDLYDEALRISGKADRNLEAAKKKLNEAQKLLDKAHDYYEETHAELERLKEEWGEAATEGESEALR